MNTTGLRASLLIVAAFCALGCREEQSITTTDVPRLTPRSRTFTPEEARASLDHMLAAIVPHGEKGWFFKLVVPAGSAEEVRKSFDEFVGSIELGDAGATPTWKLPAGWVEKPGSEMRAATIEVPHGDEKFELAVSSLPYDGKLAPYVEANFNRWLGQLQQESLPAETIAKITREASLKGGEARVVELVGVMDRQGMPGMQMPAGHPPIGPVEQATAATTSAAPGADGATAGEAKTASVVERPAAGSAAEGTGGGGEFAKPREFTYTAPQGWQPGDMSSSMRKAAFAVGEGDRQAEVTVMPFPASGAMGDPQAQAERWAGQVGLGDMRAEELEKAKSTVTIDGIEGQQFDLFGPGAAGGPQGILAAMVKRGEVMWFFKMTGERTLVESQREEFAEFLESIEFAKDE